MALKSLRFGLVSSVCVPLDKLLNSAIPLKSLDMDERIRQNIFRPTLMNNGQRTVYISSPSTSG